MYKVLQSHLAAHENIDSIICKYPGIKILEDKENLIIKNDKFEYICSIQHRFYNTHEDRGEDNRKTQKKWSEDFRKTHDIDEKGEIKILHGCKYANIKQLYKWSHLISFSTIFQTFKDNDLIKNAKIQIGYMDDLCVMKIISNSSLYKKFTSYKIYPIRGLCYDNICTPRYIICKNEAIRKIADLEIKYSGYKMITSSFDISLEDQLEIEKKSSKKLIEPIGERRYGDANSIK